MRREVVHDHHIAGPERWAQRIPDISCERFGIGRSFDAHAGARTILSQSPNHGGGLPMAVRATGMNSLPTLGTTAQPSQVGLGSRLIQKHQFGRI